MLLTFVAQLLHNGGCVGVGHWEQNVKGTERNPEGNLYISFWRLFSSCACVSTIECNKDIYVYLPYEQVVFSCHSVDVAAIEIQVIFFRNVTSTRLR